MQLHSKSVWKLSANFFFNICSQTVPQLRVNHCEGSHQQQQQQKLWNWDRKRRTAVGKSAQKRHSRLPGHCSADSQGKHLHF